MSKQSEISIQGSSMFSYTIPNFLVNICASGECSFFLNGNVIKQNCCYWSDNDADIMNESAFD